MYQPRALRTTALVAVTAAATTFLIQACGGSANAQSAPDPIVGVWESAVTQKDCTSGATIGAGRGQSVFHADGIFMDTPGGLPATRGPGFGLWTRTDTGYSMRFRFFRFNADGTSPGVTVITRTMVMGADGNTATGDSKVQVLDSAGNVIAQVCASDTSTRFR